MKYLTLLSVMLGLALAPSPAGADEPVEEPRDDAAEALDEDPDAAADAPKPPPTNEAGERLKKSDLPPEPAPQPTPESTPEPEPESEPEPDVEPAPKPGPKTHGHHHQGLRLALPGGIRINGRFDVIYERRGYTNDFDGEHAIRNFHHFVFLSRSTKSDPFFFNAEVIDLSYFEFGARLRGDGWKLALKGGKVMVPFGADPLYHHMYSGLAAFDNQLLPVIWARYGAVVGGRFKAGPLSVLTDLYTVVGHAIDEPDQVLNLKSDLSPLDDKPMPAFGLRLGLAWEAITAYYSIYANPIGFERNLVMQAVDLTVWRIADVPVVEDLALTVGVMRADVTGGSQPDYYHFGDYLQLRYYPTDWLYVQYRTGMQSFDNGGGAWLDDRDSRLDDSDFSVHSVGVTGTWYGFSLSLMHVWRLERDIERPNDFLRLTAAYEF